MSEKPKSDLLRIQEGKILAEGLVHSSDKRTCSYYYIFNSLAYDMFLQLKGTDFTYSQVVFTGGYYHIEEIPASDMTYRSADFANSVSELWLKGKVALHERNIISDLKLQGGKIISHPQSAIINCFLTNVEFDRGNCKSCFHNKGEIGVKPYGPIDPTDYLLESCYLQDCIIERCITIRGILDKTKRGPYLQAIESYDASSKEIVSSLNEMVQSSTGSAKT